MVARTQLSYAVRLAALACMAMPVAQAAVSSSFKVGIVITRSCPADDGHGKKDQHPGPPDQKECKHPHPRVEIEDAPRPAMSGVTLDARTRIRTITF